MSAAAAAIGYASGPPAMVRDSGKPVAVWNPREVATQYIDSERSSHKKRTYPEAPITMHTLPVRSGARFTVVATISFMVVLASGHLVS
jgi:hypothetical protein